MAELRICAIGPHGAGGPSLPLDFGAWIVPGGYQDIPELNLQLGDVHITLWPADPEKIRELGEKLIRIAEDLRREF